MLDEAISADDLTAGLASIYPKAILPASLEHTLAPLCTVSAHETFLAYVSSLLSGCFTHRGRQWREMLEPTEVYSDFKLA